MMVLSPTEHFQEAFFLVLAIVYSSHVTCIPFIYLFIFTLIDPAYTIANRFGVWALASKSREKSPIIY